MGKCWKMKKKHVLEFLAQNQFVFNHNGAFDHVITMHLRHCSAGLALNPNCVEEILMYVTANLIQKLTYFIVQSHFCSRVGGLRQPVILEHKSARIFFFGILPENVKFENF